MSALPPSQRRKVQNGPLEDFMRQAVVLGRIAEAGDMEKYKGMIGGLEERERRLIAFYELVNLGGWKKVVEYRLGLLREELEGLSGE